MKTKVIESDIFCKLQTYVFNKTGRNVLAAVVGFVLASAELLKTTAPFGVAFCAALSLPVGCFALLGAALGYLLQFGLGHSMVMLFSMLFTLAVRLILGGEDTTSVKSLRQSLLAALSVFAVSCIVNLFYHASFFSYVLGGGDALLCGVLTYAIATVLPMVEHKGAWHVLQTRQILSFITVGSMLLIALSRFGFLYFSLGRIVGICLLLTFVHHMGFAGGAVAGILIGASLCLYDPDRIALYAVAAFAALAAGAMPRLGKRYQVVLFVSITMFGVLLVGQSLMQLIAMPDVLVASALFLLLPDTWLRKLSWQFQSIGLRTQPGVQAHGAKLQFATDTIQTLGKSIDTASKQIDRYNRADISTVYTAASERVCKRCGKANICWGSGYHDTMDAFNQTTKSLRQNGKLVPEDLPGHFKKQCSRHDEFICAINSAYRTFCAQQAAQATHAQPQVQWLSQFELMTTMLCEISEEMSDVQISDVMTATVAKQLFTDLGIEPLEVCCAIDKYDRISIDVYLDTPPHLEMEQLTQTLSEAVECKLDQPSVMVIGNKTKLLFFEKARYQIDYSMLQKPAHKGQACGDCFTYFVDGHGFAHLVLSDGMGTGNRAAIDSSMTCAFLKKLLVAGFSYDSALRFINTAFSMCHADDESLATIDAMYLDLYTAQAVFQKAGAASSFVYHGGRVDTVATSTLPIGILGEVSADQVRYRLAPSDVVVFVSDGVIEQGSVWLEQMIVQNAALSCEQLATQLLKEACKRNRGNGDDMTVVVAKIQTNN